MRIWVAVGRILRARHELERGVLLERQVCVRAHLPNLGEVLSRNQTLIERQVCVRALLVRRPSRAIMTIRGVLLKRHISDRAHRVHKLQTRQAIRGHQRSSELTVSTSCTTER